MAIVNSNPGLVRGQIPTAADWNGYFTGKLDAANAGAQISDSPPSSPQVGQLWFDSIGQQLYVWYNDGTSSQWAIANADTAPAPATTTPFPDGTLVGSPGTLNTYSRGDHQHPPDPTRLATSGGAISGDVIVSGTAALLGTSTAVTPPTPDNSTLVATTAFVKNQGYTTSASVPVASTITPVMDGTATVGVDGGWAHGDHRHPTDTSRVADTGDTMTGALTIVNAGSVALQANGFIQMGGGQSNIGAALPTNPGGGLMVAWNRSNGSRETDFLNTDTLAATSFNFYQYTAATTATLLASMTPSLLTLNIGESFNTGTASSTTDLSKHIALSGTNYGFGFTSGALNVVAGGTLAMQALPVGVSLLGVPTAPTATAGTNTTQIATTAFAAAAAAAAGVQTFNTRSGPVVLLSADVLAVQPASTITPLMDGTAAVGTNATSWARADHVHGSDTSRVTAAGGTLTGGTLAGTTTNSGTISGGTLAGTLTLTGTISGGTLSAPALIGVPTAPTAASGTSTTQIATTAFVLGSRQDQFQPPNVDVPWNSHKITSLLDPTNAQDAATKNYVDLTVQGLDAKLSCRVATTVNLAALSGLLTIDGVTVASGDRVLVKDQTTQSANGVYVAAAGAWARSIDMDVWTEFVSAYVFIEQGTANADNGYLCTVVSGGTLGTTAVTWVQFSGAGQVIAGSGLTKTGNQLDVVGTASRILVSADSIDIDPAWVGQASITTLGTITTGTWNASTIQVNRGGTGATTLTGYVKGAGAVALTASATIPNADIAGLGTMATQAASAVVITGGTISGSTLSADTLTGVTTNSGTISGGTISAATVTGGTFAGAITNSATVTGGTQAGTLTLTGTISGGTLGGTIVNGGTISGGNITGLTGLDLGSGVAASTIDVTRHLGLWGTTYGIGVTTGAMNIVTNGTLSIQAIGTGAALFGNPTATTAAVGTNTTRIATTAFVQAAIPAVAPSTIGRNVIHNPLFNVQQRGLGPWTTTLAYTADRWLLQVSLDTTSVTLVALVDADRTAIGDETAAFCLQNTFTGIASGFTIVGQRVEGVRRFANRSVTVSFWAAATSGTPKFGIGFDQNFGAGGSPSATVNGTGQSVTLSTTWTRYSVTFAIPSVATKTLGTTANSDYTQFSFWYSAGAAFNVRSGTVGIQGTFTVSLWGMQAEVGSSLTPLERPDPRYDLSNCQRFYTTMSVFVPAVASPDTLVLPTTMRNTPAVAGGGAGFVTTGATAGPAAITVGQTTGAAQTLTFSADY